MRLVLYVLKTKQRRKSDLLVAIIFVLKAPQNDWKQLFAALKYISDNNTTIAGNVC